MSRRKSKSGLSTVLLVVSLLMIGYGAYMSFVDLTYDVASIPDVPEVPVDDSQTTVVVLPPPDTRYEPIYRPIKPLPDIDFAYANLFGGDGQINLANIILFLGIGLFVMSFFIGRRF